MTISPIFTQPLRQSTFRFDLVDQLGAHLGELTVRRDSPPTMAVDTGSSLKRTVTGLALPPGELAAIDLIKDRINITHVFPDGTSFPLGRYLFTSPDEDAFTAPIFEDTSATSTIDLVDQLLIIDQLTPTAVALRPGAVITDFLATFLSQYPVEVDITPSGMTIGAEALTWPPATSGLSIINDLATMLGYHELYFANDGRGRLGPMPDPLTTSPDLIIDVTSRIVRPSVTRANTLLDLPNRLIVVGNGATDTPVVGVYDVPATAPHSAVNRGYIVTYSEQQQGISTVAEAQAAAAALSRQQSFAYETVSFSTPIDPRFDHYNVVQIETVPFLEVSWSTTLLEGAQMQHTVRRTYQAA